MRKLDLWHQAERVTSLQVTSHSLSGVNMVDKLELFLPGSSSHPPHILGHSKYAAPAVICRLSPLRIVLVSRG